MTTAPSHIGSGSVGIAEYISMASNKTGALLGRACALGASRAGANSIIRKAFYRFGARSGSLFTASTTSSASGAIQRPRASVLAATSQCGNGGRDPQDVSSPTWSTHFQWKELQPMTADISRITVAERP